MIALKTNANLFNLKLTEIYHFNVKVAYRHLFPFLWYRVYRNTSVGVQKACVKHLNP